MSAPTAPFRDQERGGTALLIIDMIGPMDFPEADDLRDDLARAAEAITGLRAACDAAAMPVIYANDNCGEWHSEASRLVETALAEDCIAARSADRKRGVLELLASNLAAEIRPTTGYAFDAWLKKAGGEG